MQKNYGSSNSWLGRSLENYKKLQSKVAERKGLTRELRDAPTLTAARKLLFGIKKGSTK
jgi:hypothetical protein